jgi:hypothetical protein
MWGNRVGLLILKPHIDPLNLWQTALPIGSECLAMGIGRLRLRQETADAQGSAIADVCFDVRQLEPKAGTNRNVIVLGINWPFEFFDGNDCIKFVEVRNATSCVATEPSRIA